MTHETVEAVFNKRIAACSDLKALLVFAENALARERRDLAQVALSRLSEVFGSKSVAPSLIPSRLREMSRSMGVMKDVRRAGVAWRRVNRGGSLIRRPVRTVLRPCAPYENGMPAVRELPANEARFHLAA